MTDKMVLAKQEQQMERTTNLNNDWFDLILLCLTPLSAIFQLYHGDQFYWWKKHSTRREPPTMCKQLVNFITCGCESSAPIFVIYKAGREPTPYWW